MTTNQELWEGLSALLNFVGGLDPEERCDIRVSASLWVSGDTSREQLATWVRRVGHGDKVATDYAYGIRRAFGPVTLQVLAGRSEVCEAKQVGERVIPAQPEYTVPIMKWTCDPILADFVVDSTDEPERG